MDAEAVAINSLLQNARRASAVDRARTANSARTKRRSIEILRSLGNSESGVLVYPVLAVAPTDIKEISSRISSLQTEVAVLERSVSDQLRRRLSRRQSSKSSCCSGSSSPPHSAKLSRSCSGAATQSPPLLRTVSPTVATSEATNTVAHGEWEAVVDEHGRTYYWNTVSEEVTWEVPQQLRPQQLVDALTCEVPQQLAEANGDAPSDDSPDAQGAPRHSRASTSSVTSFASERAAAATVSSHAAATATPSSSAALPRSCVYVATRPDMATRVFQKFNATKSGELSDAELDALCTAMDRPATNEQLALFRRLLDVDGDGRIHLWEFAEWWREGEHRWDYLTRGAEHERRVRGLASFFDAFTPEDGALIAGEQRLSRMHACLLERGRSGTGTAKSLHSFLADVDPDGDGRVTLAKLHRWYFREDVDRAPPSLPTFGELRRPFFDMAREDFLEERRARAHGVQAMKVRAGRKI